MTAEKREKGEAYTTKRDLPALEKYAPEEPKPKAPPVCNCPAGENAIPALHGVGCPVKQ